MFIKHLSYQTHDYFALYEQEQFIFEIIGGICAIAQIFKHNGNYYYVYKGQQIKCITTPSMRLRHFAGWTTRLNNDKYHIYGRIAGGGWGLSDSKFIYIFWDKTATKNGLSMHIKKSIPTNFPMPYALTNINDLIPIGIENNS